MRSQASMPDTMEPLMHSASVTPVDAAPMSDVDGEECPTCAARVTPPSYVYAIGKIEARFPSLSIEKEFAQATGRADTKGMTETVRPCTKSYRGARTATSLANSAG